MHENTPDMNQKRPRRGLFGAIAAPLAWLLPWRWPDLLHARREAQLAADLAATMPDAPTAEPSDDHGEAVEDDQLWPDRRVRMVERLWGEGQTLPGAADFVHTYLPLMALSEKKSIAILGANMGGLNQTLVEDTGVWIAGYEADPELAERGHARMTMMAMKRKAPITPNDMEALELKPKSLDGVVSLESLFTVENKEELFRTIAEGLRVDGELFYTDYVLPGVVPPTPEVAEWFKNETHHPYLWTADKTQSFLVSLGLDVRPHQDITAEYRRQVLKGWMGFLANISKAELLDMAEDVFAECAFWARRIAALDSGGLRVYKFNAFKMPDY